MAARFGQLELEAHLRWAEETLKALRRMKAGRQRPAIGKEKRHAGKLYVRPQGAKAGAIASWKHLAGFLAIMAALLVLGLYQQHAGGSGTGQIRTPGQLASHNTPSRFISLLS